LEAPRLLDRTPPIRQGKPADIPQSVTYNQSGIFNRECEMLPILIELQRLKCLDRTGWTLRGLANGTESVAAHSFGVCVTAMLLADELVARGTTVDTETVL
jgi:5'-deoxynucleotidase YfbR-like HD superfamily hydrolase